MNFAQSFFNNRKNNEKNYWPFNPFTAYLKKKPHFNVKAVF